MPGNILNRGEYSMKKEKASWVRNEIEKIIVEYKKRCVNIEFFPNLCTIFAEKEDLWKIGNFDFSRKPEKYILFLK
jgi:hypothetical protein